VESKKELWELKTVWGKVKTNFVEVETELMGRKNDL
jgi:hypothetical protein